MHHRDFCRLDSTAEAVSLQHYWAHQTEWQFPFHSVILLSPNPTFVVSCLPPPLHRDGQGEGVEVPQPVNWVRTSGVRTQDQGSRREGAQRCRPQTGPSRRTPFFDLGWSWSSDSRWRPLPPPLLHPCSRMTPYLNTRCGTLITTPAATSVIKWSLDYYLHPDLRSETEIPSSFDIIYGPGEAINLRFLWFFIPCSVHASPETSATTQKQGFSVISSCALYRINKVIFFWIGSRLSYFDLFIYT